VNGVPAIQGSSVSNLRDRRVQVALLLLPMSTIAIAGFGIPIARLGRMSFVEGRSGGALTDSLTTAHYVSFFSDSFNRSLLSHSVLLALTVTTATLVCGYPLALFLHRAPGRWRSLLFALTISPLLVSSVVRTYGWMALLGDQGPVNGALMFFGIVREPLRLVNNYVGATIGLIEILMPYMVLALISGFGRLDPALEEAAASLGAGPLERFRRIVFPLTLPGVALGCLLCFVLAISSFITPKLLGGGRVLLLATEIYDQAMVQLQWPMAATISIVVLTIFGGALALYARLVRRFE
jgi:putative spermidine/putrescine transport system permease protein